MAKKDTEVKKSKSKDEPKLTGLEKLKAKRAAEKAEAKKTGKKPAKKKKTALPTFKAPEDFKPHFVTVMMKTEKDGLLSNAIRMTRYQGRYDPEADDKKKFDVGTYDQKTVQGVLSRFSMTTFATNAAKRLPAGTVFQALLRVNRKSADGSISIIFKGLAQMEKNKKGRIVANDLDKKDPIYRKFRKATRILPAAFKEVLMPPKRTRGANKAKDESDDE